MKTKWVILLAAAAAAVGVSGDGFGATPPGPLTEVVVTLKQPFVPGRSLQSARVAQAMVVRSVERALPDAQVRWRYHLVLNGFAVALPASQVSKLAAVPGVAKIWPNLTYHALDNVSQIGAPALWGPTLATAGQGMKIGIIDEGLDASHPFFNPAGFSYPPGFPKGQVQYATPKVIVQRTFPPPHATWKNASLPFDPAYGYHATHVAGIAAGDHGTNANGRILSGVAPAAYLGNYKALTIPTPNFGLDGNSAEIAAAIEAAVADGMNVINLSIGEPEVEPSRDLVDVALANAARAGVVPVVAAGNDFPQFGLGSVGSPANATEAITVAAVDARNAMADFSSAGPTPVTLRLKPDVAAPGVSIFSSEPAVRGTWGYLDGTSMAAPHVAGAAALLLQRHPSWTVAQVKSALVLTGDPAHVGNPEASTLREGGGVVDLVKADNPLVFADPTTLSFGSVRVHATATQNVSLTDAGGGAGMWSVSVQMQTGNGSVQAPSTVDVPGVLPLTATSSAAGDATGFVVLTQGDNVRRIPFWFEGSAPKLASEVRTLLPKAGVYKGTTKGRPSRVSQYRYPTGSRLAYNGPERAYRVHVGRVANFGVVVLSGHVTAHVTFDGAEDHISGYPSLPTDINPYRDTYGNTVRVSAALLPAPGTYDIVFDSRSPDEAGPFSFRLWVNDTKPPKLKLRSVHGGIDIAATDAGSGVDPTSIHATVDGKAVPTTWRHGVIHIELDPGRHTLVLRVADYQETKNMETVPPILPNTATLRVSVKVR
jgi:subtilisin family serine protease